MDSRKVNSHVFSSHVRPLTLPQHPGCILPILGRISHRRTALWFSCSSGYLFLLLFLKKTGQRSLRKEAFIWRTVRGFSLSNWEVTVPKNEAAGHITSAVKKQRVMDAAA